MTKLSKKNKKLILISSITAFLLCVLTLVCLYTPTIKDSFSDLIKKLPTHADLSKGPESDGSDKVEKDKNAASETGQSNSTINNSQQSGKEPGDGDKPNQDKPATAQPTDRPATDNPTDKPAADIHDELKFEEDIRNLREIICTKMQGHEALYDGCFADIRIHYLNGEEYTVISAVRLTIPELPTDKSGEYRVFVSLNELAMQYLSSAVNDCEIYPKTYIYPALRKDVTAAGNDQKTTLPGNYRPSKNMIAMFTEEKMLEAAIADELLIARENLEGRLHNYIFFTTNSSDDMLPGGFLDSTTNGYWIYE